MIDPDDYIFVGKIGKTVGIKGSLTIVPLTSFPERFRKMKNLFLTKEKRTPLNLEVEKIDLSENKIIVKLKGINSEEKAKDLTGYRITVGKNERYELPRDYYYIEDLLDCEVFDQNNDLIGKIKDVIEMSSNDIYVVDYRGKDVLIPAISHFIKEIDIENKRIRSLLIDGMLPDEN
ncbi:MAG: ribosome maturation factor RimM [Candidatus Delongbacteria bacterium]